MHIREIEIDGFKSYAQKQVVGKFDEQFNAITGLNGSGKSNILDSICFVLGITNLSHIRAATNNDLIFKQGNAGVTKAFVKITFDNTGPRRFANYGEVVTITRTISIASATSKGTNNYTICGSNASCSAVADLFRSVGLNVNNPHFLIMQGRITKVLNMKPGEILGMIEEAAGTKMYDQKRNQAVSNMEKKDVRLDDIKGLMDNEILPAVQRMKDDREEYLKYQKYERDIEVLRKKQYAFVYDRAQRQSQKCTEEIAEKTEESKQTIESIEEINKEIENMSEKQKEQEKEKGEGLKNEKDEIDREVVAKRAAATEAEKKYEDIRSAIEGAEAKLTRAEGTKGSDMKALTKLEADLQKKEGELGGVEKEGVDLESEIKAAKAKLLALEQGMTTNDAGEIVSLESQITESRTRLTELVTEVKTRDARMKELERRKAEKERELAKHTKEDKEYNDEKTKNDKELATLKSEIAKMRFDAQEFSNWKEESKKLGEEIKALEYSKSLIDTDMLKNEAQFRDVPGVQRGVDVLGMIPRFFRLKSDENRHVIEHLMGNHNTTTVVRSGEVASRLMNGKAFMYRTTCVPLDGKDDENTKEARQILAKKLAVAKAIAPHGEKVDWAINLVDFDANHSYIVNHHLARVLVCDTKEAATLLCYNKEVGVRVITRDAEMDVKPSGVTGGGARANHSHGMDLTRMNEWHNAKAELEDKLPRYRELEKKIKDASTQAERHNRMMERQSELTDKIDAHQQKFQYSAVATIRTELDAFEIEIPKILDENKAMHDEMKGLKAKIHEYEDRKKNEKAFADKEKAEAKKALKNLQEREKNAKGGFEKAKNTLTAMRSEIAALIQSIKDGEDVIEQSKSQVIEHNKELAEMEKAAKDANVAQNIAEDRRKAFIEKMKKHDENMNQLRKMIEKGKKDIQQKNVRLEEIEREKAKLKDDFAGWMKEAKDILKGNPWISDVKEHFGQKGTNYDFTGYNHTVGLKKIQEMEVEMKKMNANINMDTMSLLASAEERVMALQKKRDQIKKDKEKLWETIEKLDEKKKVELQAAYKSVNKDFNGIFSMLLPGTSAKLDPADGKDPLKGIEIKVAFNGKWKDSLGELSGGQRSLVALSLVLAMLKFRPAPLYILDEVDAALDLSHTQNIGAMIKTHFKESQFIIVSLKEGMFNHANVLFRTRFVDGTSQVSRTDNTK